MEPLTEYLPLVTQIARSLARSLPDHIDLNDLISAGHLALVEAAQRYEQRNDAGFHTFAGYRIRGAMLDELRTHNWLPRSIHKHWRVLSTATAQLEQRLGRRPTNRELAAHTGLTLDRIHEVFTAMAQNPLPMPDDSDDIIHPVTDPEELLEREQTLEHLIASMTRLKPRLQNLITRIYLDDQLHTEVAAAMDVTPARISQLHKEAIEHLRKLAA